MDYEAVRAAYAALGVEIENAVAALDAVNEAVAEYEVADAAVDVALANLNAALGADEE
jgi:hypothetical protein